MIRSRMFVAAIAVIAECTCGSCGVMAGVGVGHEGLDDGGGCGR